MKKLTGKLTVRMTDTSIGMRPVLCDENGVILPGQASVTIKYDMAPETKIIVEFNIDGNEVAFSQEPGRMS